MKGNESKVKIAVDEAGLDPAAAIKATLGMSMTDFARSRGLNPDNLIGLINGTAATPYYAYRDALAEHLGVSREWLDEQLPVPSSAAPEG